MLRPFTIVSFLLALILAISCRQTGRNSSNVTDKFPLYFDSTQFDKFLTNHAKEINQKATLKTFYGKRNYRFSWMTGEGVNEQAGSFLNMLYNEKSTSASTSDFSSGRLYDLFNLVSEKNYKITSTDSNAIYLEILLSSSFFDYAKRNWGGVSNDYSKKVEWFIERKKINYVDLLDSLLSGKISEEPVYRQYGLLKKQLLKYDSIEKAGGWSVLPSQLKKAERGDTSHLIPEIREQLLILGDLPNNNKSNLFDETLETGIKSFQQRHGLEEDGIIGGATVQALNIPVHDRIRQILINMERCRWVPLQLEGDYLVVNIPAYRLYVYHNDELEWSCNVVVGKTTTKTAIFNAQVEYVVFNPYWNIPSDIFSSETLPEIKANSNYLAAHNMEVVDNNGKTINSGSIRWKKYDGNDFPYIVRQRPGPDNSLGKVKFLFPNAFDIYLHDTPAKSLFEENKRTFSHGCIRVEDPMKLARYLLRDEEKWTEDAIQKVLDNEKQVFVKLKNKIPVFITYFTAWVDREGKLNFRDDIYQHDERMMALLLN